ncbi:MAG: hypothetical protein AW09_003379 [Candidatus Accumulibacter phosphatis]|uniref:Uncharacterized protein n=1 Tax=Candidatus Accumulibacter phosphatis TaxID=327160 RepID=A0A080LSU9_9PROT|nr:MAG: hypothetical protein AW09_003379 [Candidatus Accumulibacter phosphatis]
MATDVAVPVGANDHRHGVPADVVMNPDFQVGIAGILRLLVDRNGVDVFSGGTVGNVDSLLARLGNQAFDQEVGTLGALLVDDAAQGVLPFLGLLWVRIVHAGRQRVFGQICHDLSPDLQNCEWNGSFLRAWVNGNGQIKPLQCLTVPQCNN